MGGLRNVKKGPGVGPLLDLTLYRLDVVVKSEFVRMWSQPECINFVLSLVGDPGVNHVLREDSALQEEVVVGLQRVECFFQ